MRHADSAPASRTGQRRRAFLFRLAVGLAVGVAGPAAEAQPTPLGQACQADLDVARAAVDEGYAGRGRYTPDEERGIAEQRAALRAEAGAAESAAVCDGVLRAWAALYRDRHLYVSLRRARPGTATPDTGPPPTPSLDFVGSRAAVLRVPSFGVRYKPAIDSLLAVHHDRLLSTPHLVVDVRGNGGGGDSAFDGIAALLYTGPFALAGAEVYASEGNTAFYTALACDEGLPEDVRTWAADLAALMRTGPGAFVEFAGEQRVERDTVYRYPEAVAVLVDGRSASTTEEFVLHARHSAKTTVLGDTTRGALDYANLRTVPLPSGERDLEVPTTRRSWLPAFSVDRAGLAPDVAVPEGVEDGVSFAMGYLHASPTGPPRPRPVLAPPGLLAAAGTAPADSIVYVEVTPWQGGDCTDAFAGTGAVRPCRARTPWSEAELRARWVAEGRPVWADGDTLTFVYEGDAPGVDACCAVQMPMSRFAGSTLWVLSARVPDLAFATVGYGFLPDGVQRLEETGTWRGSAAPAPPPEARVLRGTVRTDSLWSEALGERRAVTVYLPPNHDVSRATPVVYVADGQAVDGLATYLEPFILAGEVPPTALVGLHSGDFRGEEYTSISEETGEADDANARFVAHERFVLDEVLPWAERSFGVSARRGGRAAFGFSNGGVWAAFQGVRHPDVFGAALSFSCGVCAVPVPDAPPPASTGPDARFYFLAGRLEAGFHRSTSAAAARLRAAGYEALMHERVAGHDSVMWHEQFGDAVRWAFGSASAE